MHDRLVEIQQTLKAPKGQNNSFGNYKYRSCEDILEAVKPLLKGLSLTLSDEVVNIGTANYVKATATLRQSATDKVVEGVLGFNEISTTAFAREAETKKGMDEAQITGAASSYARKYALNGLFAIDDTKDADSQDNTQHVPNQDPLAEIKQVARTKMAKAPGKPSDKQVTYARELMVQHGFTGKVAGEMIELFIGKKVPVSGEDYSRLISALKDYKPDEGNDSIENYINEEPSFE